MPKYQFKEIEIISSLHVIEANSLHEAIAKYEEKRENFEFRGMGTVDKTEYRGPRPVCDNCKTTPSTTFAIPCCRQPSYPHGQKEIEVMAEIAEEEE